MLDGYFLFSPKIRLCYGKDYSWYKDGFIYWEYKTGVMYYYYFSMEERKAKGEKYYKAGDSGQKKENDEKSSDYIATKKIDNGKSLVPYYSLKPVMVTKSNLDSIIIDSGFHTKEEVYLNVTKKKS